MKRDTHDQLPWTEIVGSLRDVEISNGQKALTIGTERIVINCSASKEEIEQLIGKQVSVLYTGKGHLIKVGGDKL